MEYKSNAFKVSKLFFYGIKQCDSVSRKTNLAYLNFAIVARRINHELQCFCI